MTSELSEVYDTTNELVGKEVSCDLAKSQSVSWILIQYNSFASFFSSGVHTLDPVAPDDIGVGFFNDWEAAFVFSAKFFVLC